MKTKLPSHLYVRVELESKQCANESSTAAAADETAMKADDEDADAADSGGFDAERYLTGPSGTIIGQFRAPKKRKRPNGAETLEHVPVTATSQLMLHPKHALLQLLTHASTTGQLRTEAQVPAGHPMQAEVWQELKAAAMQRVPRDAAGRPVMVVPVQVSQHCTHLTLVPSRTTTAVWRRNSSGAVQRHRWLVDQHLERNHSVLI